MTHLENFGNRIKQRRLSLDMTQTELAKLSGYTSRSSINKIELGLIDIPQSKIVAIANALQCPPAYLVSTEANNDIIEYKLNNLDLSVGERIKKLRLKKCVTQEELGQFIGVQKSAIHKYESGLIENIKQSTIKKLADYFEVTPSYILGWEEESQPTCELPIKRQDYDLSEKFLQDYSELLKDKSFLETTKLYNEISPELRALALGYIVGILQKYKVDTQKILGY